MDFTAILAAVDATTIVAALGAIAAIKILPNVARWGYNKVISFIS
jgi:DNA-binding phage protein